MSRTIAIHHLSHLEDRVRTEDVGRIRNHATETELISGEPWIKQRSFPCQALSSCCCFFVVQGARRLQRYVDIDHLAPDIDQPENDRIWTILKPFTLCTGIMPSPAGYWN